MSKRNKWVKLTTSNRKLLDKRAEYVKGNFANILRDIRNKKGYSQAQLAIITGVNRKTISRIENGHYSPNLMNLVKIFEVLDIKSQKVFAA